MVVMLIVCWMVVDGGLLDGRGDVDVVVTGKVIVVVVDGVLLVKEERISTRRSRSESEKRGSGND
jgi:hypothetical protein